MKASFKKWRLVTAAMGLLSFAAFVGSISGSIAWWAYSTRAGVSFTGTAVLTSQQLQAGLKHKTSEFDVSHFASDNDLVSVEIGDYTYLFSETTGGLSTSLIREYLTLQNKYAIDKLSPITSGSYNDDGTNVTLKKSLIRGQRFNDDPADKSAYVKLPLAFRILHIDSVHGDSYAKNQPIWINGVEANPLTYEDGNINKALRIFVDGETKFILNPTSEESGETKVGGFLNLDAAHDEYYDTAAVTKNIGGIDTKVYEEIPYGEFSSLGDSVPVVGGEERNMNNVSDTSIDTTFYAKHSSDTYYYEPGTYTPKTAAYKSINDIKPIDSDTAILTGGVPVTTTSNDDENPIADLDIYIWLEGWDHAVIDQEVSHSFSLDILFQINLA